MAAYYNEIDPFAAAWLRELIKDGLIADGEVDERSIEDVVSTELAGYTQCHFFAGIGVWSLALRQAGWTDDQPIWTGSCPCQPFSAAGKGGGFADERHLWPAFYHLIGECRPGIVVGEQVASKDGLGWLDLVQADLEGAGYANGAVDICAAGFGAPHIRQRLYWVANAGCGRIRSSGHQLAETKGGVQGEAREQRIWIDDRHGSDVGRLADTHGWNASAERQQHGGEQRQQSQDSGAGIVAYADDQELAFGSGEAERCGTVWNQGQAYAESGVHDGDGRPSPTNGYWRDADWLRCTDEKWRAVEPGAFPLADAGAFRNRVGLLRGAGNAITIGQAQGFIEAVMECA